MFFDGAPLPSWAPAAAYALFWLAQLAFASASRRPRGARAGPAGGGHPRGVRGVVLERRRRGGGVDRHRACGPERQRAGAEAGSPARAPRSRRARAGVLEARADGVRHVDDAGHRGARLRAENDHAQVGDAGRHRGPARLRRRGALVGSSLAQAPNLALYSALLVACLVTNAATNVVGPMTWVKQGAGRRLSSGAAAAIVTSIAAVAAYAVLPWQTVVAYASWAVGAGALFVAPAAGVVVADYWVCRDRGGGPRRAADGGGDGRVRAGGTNYRAVAALFAGMVPELWSFASNIAADLAARNAGALTLQSVMDSVRALIGWLVFNSEYSAVIAAATAFVTYVSLTVMFVPGSLKVARAGAALSATSARARARARRRRRGGGECRGDGQVRRRRRRRAAGDARRRGGPSPSPPSTRTSCPARSSGRRRRRKSWSPR